MLPMTYSSDLTNILIIHSDPKIRWIFTQFQSRQLRTSGHRPYWKSNTVLHVFPWCERQFFWSKDIGKRKYLVYLGNFVFPMLNLNAHHIPVPWNFKSFLWKLRVIFNFNYNRMLSSTAKYSANKGEKKTDRKYRNLGRRDLVLWL